MKFKEWNEIAELVGIAAIVGSLLFVGLQMKQTQSIAESERFEITIGNRVEIRNAINEHADIWIRGNAGAELDPGDAVIYENLIQNLATQSQFSSFASDRLGNQRGAVANRTTFIMFLHKNPGARRLWETLQTEVKQTENLLHPDQYTESGWAGSIRSGLAKLDRAKK